MTKALVGTLIVLAITNGLTTLSVQGGITAWFWPPSCCAAAVVDIRWLKNRYRIVSKVYVSPTYHGMPPSPRPRPIARPPYAVNDRLRRRTRSVSAVSRARKTSSWTATTDNLYAGSRHGDIIRFLAPDYQRMEVFAHIGGTPLGMAFDRHDNLYVCIGGMGLYRVTPERKVEKATDETNRSLSSVNDDSRLRLADDFDITADGRVFFSEATVRFEMHEWATDGLEARGNGRIICFDTNTGKTHTVIRDLKFPNGVCIASDGVSFLFAETWGCSVKRHWFDGPKKGKTEMVLENLPGFPDNINNSSDGNYWMSLVGMRCPALDLAWKMPGFFRIPYYVQAKGLIEGGSDLLLVETAQDTRNVKAALLAIQELSTRDRGAGADDCLRDDRGDGFDARPGRRLRRCGRRSLCEAAGVRDELRDRAGIHDGSHPNAEPADGRVCVVLPECGVAGRRGQVSGDADVARGQLEKFVDHGWLNIVGGCCGTTEKHIQAIAQMADGKKPRVRPAEAHRAIYSGIETIESDDSTRPLLVGERTNVIGSRLFKNLIAEEKWEEASEIARRQVRGGAQIVDVCLQSTDRDERKRYPAVLREADPQDQGAGDDRHHRPGGDRTGADVLPGQSDHQFDQPGGRRGEIRARVPIAHDFGAAVVVGCIDEDPVQAQAFTRERKLAIAQRSVFSCSRRNMDSRRGHRVRSAGVSLRHRR